MFKYNTNTTEDSSIINLGEIQLTLNSVLDAITNDFIIVDKNNIISYVNLKAKTNLLSEVVKLGMDFSTLGEHLTAVYELEETEKLADLLKRAVPESFISEVITIHLTKSTKKTYDLSTSPIYDAHNGHVGRVWQFIDVTIRENIDNIKTEFISIASHQLRTPLTSIRGYVEMILEGDYGQVPSELLEPLKYVQTGGKEMADLINDLLDISRLDKSNNQNTISQVNFDEIINEIKEMFKNKLVEKNINFEYVTYKQGLIIDSDREKIKEALKNLIDNAIKYNRAGGKLAVKISEAPDSQIKIEVEDNGLGIPEDQQERVFEKFFRAANVLTENFDGTGLGLYYVKEVVTKLGGTIAFKSQINSGTTFTIILPVKLETK